MAKPETSKSNQVWDCGSALYDSVELTSFQKQIDSAIISSSRTFSMPRLPSQSLPPQPPSPSSQKTTSKKLSRSFQKFLRSVFRAARPNSKALQVQSNKEGKCSVVYEKPDALSAIPEIPEAEVEVEVRSLLRKTMSDRFTAASVGIYCA